MTKAEYLKIKRRKGGFTTCSYRESLEADALVKQEALRSLHRTIGEYDLPKPIAEWMMIVASSTYGTVETDEMLTAIKAYPKWI